MPNTDPAPQAADLEEFDLEGFIAGVVQPSKVVAVSQNRALGQQIEEVRGVVADLEEKEADAKSSGSGSRRRAGTASTPELDAARSDLADLESQAAGTYVYVRVEGGLTRAIRDQAQNDSRGDKDRYNMSVIAHCARVHKADPRAVKDSPGRVLSIEQWEQFEAAVGFLQYDAIVDAMIEVTTVGVTPDFSQPASHSPDGGESSKN